mmetsp:Transcript_7420/g.6655  ORF Transcript_7420/g.6655 Transcript_7420/m.6655 type:complete len:100 (-) Transcript_7420:31-330(-)
MSYDLHSNVRSIYTSGDQIYGMSGSPVFNGCGLVAVACSTVYSEQDYRKLNTSMYGKSGAETIPIKYLMELLSLNISINFAIKSDLPYDVVNIPVKSYC